MEIQNIHALQEHSLHFLQMALSDNRHKYNPHPDGYGKKTGQCGDTVAMYLSFAGDQLFTVNFEINGCLHTHACANTVAYLAEGKNLDQAWDITPDDVIEYLQSLPRAHVHCAELAVGAFYLALANFQARRPMAGDSR
jgi:nitrogen fixation protein NifU and related proteins